MCLIELTLFEGVDSMYIVRDHIIQIVYLFFHVCPMYSVLLSTDSTYSCVPGDQGGPVFFQRIFSAVVSCTNWCTTWYITCPILPKNECKEFVCNKFVLVLLQIDII